MSILKKSIIVVILILIADQALKIWVKTSMFIGESSYTHWGWSMKWAQLHFTENPGMAFGWALPGEQGKVLLSIFRIIAIIVIAIYIYRLSKKNTHQGFIICLALILAGAAGNIIDSMFYGMIFSGTGYSENTVAQIFPSEGGYASFLHGRVVDMLYFPMIEGNYPGWVPFVGGEEFQFFRPIFNIADSAITVGVFTIIIFQKRFFNSFDKKLETSASNS